MEQDSEEMGVAAQKGSLAENAVVLGVDELCLNEVLAAEAATLRPSLVLVSVAASISSAS